jgi:hypothetical protein
MAPDNRCFMCGRPEINGYFECGCPRASLPTRAKLATPLRVPHRPKEDTPYNE